MNTITDKIKTFEDACQALGVNIDVMPIGLPIELKHHLKALTAHTKLVIIAEALNEGWKPDWNNWNERKYYPWFEMGSPSVVGFSSDGCDTWNAYSNVGSRLCFKNRELAEYAGKQFESLYKDYFVIE
ncbi:hypothetical protein MYRA21_0098 [Myroides sp. A21]|uniref:hypothetical protein n=1 Tax=Myroides sp. A21 TaxID=1583100 RepID=UPI000585F40F|nr:hypothetical protein [Myroides sp. A21]AJA67342.1 hypothetical protein MYRA21_0098 [Myroides sp. A21]